VPKVAIITDTDSDLPDDVAARYGIRQVPINVHFGQETFKANIEIGNKMLFDRIDREGGMPTTSAPAPEQFTAAFKAAIEEGAREIVCFCVSSKMSATYKTALVAREMYPSHTIEIVDTQTLSMAQGFMVIAAAEAAQNGADAAGVIQHALNTRDHTYLHATLATLKYMAMSGRVGYVTAGIANLLSIKPILVIRDGKLEMLERVRSQNKAWGRVIELVGQISRNALIKRMAILHACAPDAAEAFRQHLSESVLCPQDIIISELTPGLSVHTGTGVICLVSVTV